MSNSYHNAVRLAIEVLEAHSPSDGPLKLEVLAQQVHLSPYHFHRIFKVVTGETPADYWRRLTLQKAANALFHQHDSITHIALDSGFQSSQSFSKAFRKHFGVTPSAVRGCQSLDDYVALMRNSKIGHRLRKVAHDGLTWQRDNALSNPTWSIAMKTEKLPAFTLAYVRVVGPYGEGYDTAMGQLFHWFGGRGLPEGEVTFIYHDNPEITPADQCRTDVGLTVPEGTAGSGAVAIRQVPEASYATLRRAVTEPKQYAETWHELMAQVVSAELALADSPCFERYHSHDPATGHADVSFYVSIEV